MTNISKTFSECNLRSQEVIEDLKSGKQAVIDQVASKIYSNMLRGGTGIEYDPDWSKKDEKLKWVLHTLVGVFGTILKTEDQLDRVKLANYKAPELMTELAYELKFVLLDLLGLYYELNYSTWNLIDRFTPDIIKEDQLLRFVKPAVQPPPDSDQITEQQDNRNRAVLRQTLTNWEHWSQVYKNLLIRTYDENDDDTLVAFHSLLAVSANLISASHMGSLLLMMRARSVRSLR